MNLSSASSSTSFAANSVSNATASSGVARVHGDADGDCHHHGAGGMRGAGGFAKLMSGVFQALAQTNAAPANQSGAATAVPTTTANPVATDSAATQTPAVGSSPDPTQDVLQKVVSFMQTLFSAMGQIGGHHHHHHHHDGEHHEHGGAVAATGADSPAQTPVATITDVASATSAPSATPVATGATTASPVKLYTQHEHRGGFAGKLQALLDQVTKSDVATAASGPLADLNNAFQSLFSALHPTATAGADAATTQPTLKDFLQKLVQNIAGKVADTGAVAGSLINTTA